ARLLFPRHADETRRLRRAGRHGRPTGRNRRHAAAGGRCDPCVSRGSRPVRHPPLHRPRLGRSGARPALAGVDGSRGDSPDQRGCAIIRRMAQADTKYATFADFYPFYLSEHANRTCRRLHFVGTSLGFVWFATAIATQNAWWLLAGFVCGYAFAWVGHF